MKPAYYLLPLLAACGGDPPATKPPLSATNYPMPLIANAVGPSDPLSAGQYYFLYYTWGAEVAPGGWPVSFLQDVLKKEPDFFGNQFSKFGFIPDPNDDLPIGYKRGNVDPTRATTTCAPCHVGALPDGKIWFGAPALTMDEPRLEAELDKRWVALGHPSTQSAATAARANAYGPGRFRIDSDDYPRAVPANIPVHYNLSERSHLSTVGGTHDVRSEVYLSVGAQVGFPLDANAPIPFPPEAEVDAMANFMGTRNPPTAPAQDASLIASGKSVFASAHCDTCHHPDDIGKDSITTIDTAVGGIDRLPTDDPANFPLGSIHCDPQQYYMAFGDPSSMSNMNGIDPRTLIILQFVENHHLKVGFSNGYLVPNLHGLWASAPYLGNGSVPTLADLFKPAAQRPPSFVVDNFTLDTSVLGNSNMGHEFGTSLSPTDQTALIAYLNSL